MSWDLKALGSVSLQSILLPWFHCTYPQKMCGAQKVPSVHQFSDFLGSIIEFAKLCWLLLLQEAVGAIKDSIVTGLVPGKNDIRLWLQVRAIFSS